MLSSTRPVVSTTCCLVIVASAGSSAIDFGRVVPFKNSSVNPRSANAAVLHARAVSVTSARILTFMSLPYLQLRGEKSKPAHHDRPIGGLRRLLDVVEIRRGRVARAVLLLVDLAQAAVGGRERRVGRQHAPIGFL